MMDSQKFLATVLCSLRDSSGIIDCRSYRSKRKHGDENTAKLCLYATHFPKSSGLSQPTEEDFKLAETIHNWALDSSDIDGIWSDFEKKVIKAAQTAGLTDDWRAAFLAYAPVLYFNCKKRLLDASGLAALEQSFPVDSDVAVTGTVQELLEVPTRYGIRTVVKVSTPETPGALFSWFVNRAPEMAVGDMLTLMGQSRGVRVFQGVAEIAVARVTAQPC
tara:strand:+ start:61 stop:717 length:657 start_codon:yes stop_codon:yes gene_type:complete